MTATTGSAWRQVVPRWRPWRTTELLGEVVVARGHSLGREAGRDLVERLLAQYGAMPTVGLAGDLLAAAIVLGDRRNSVLDVAKKTLDETGRPALREVARTIIEGDSDRNAAKFTVEEFDSRRRARKLRAILKREPRNSVRWVDLSREYLTLGQYPQAVRSMQIALGLAPFSRFVLRSAAALFVQGDELERALRVVQGSPAANADPWLIAPQLAIQDLMGTKLTLMRSARNALDGDYPPTHLAEVAAALGTIEVASGAGRRGRQLLRRSIGEPTENALAQVEWCAQLTNHVIVENMPFGIPRPFEAMARRASFDAQWDLGVGYARSWFNDQPFTPDGMTFASFCATAKEDWHLGKELAGVGLRTHPDNPILLNNYAFALIELDELPEAVDALLKARSVSQDPGGFVRAATEALLLFRAGLPSYGRKRYRAVIDVFSRRHSNELAARAILMLAREELLAGSDWAEPAWKEACELADKTQDAGIGDLRKRVGRLFGETGTPLGNPEAGTRAVVEPLIGSPRELESV